MIKLIHFIWSPIGGQCHTMKTFSCSTMFDYNLCKLNNVQLSHNAKQELEKTFKAYFCTMHKSLMGILLKAV